MGTDFAAELAPSLQHAKQLAVKVYISNRYMHSELGARSMQKGQDEAEERK